MSKNNYLGKVATTMDESRVDEFIDKVIELKQYMNNERMSADVAIGLTAHLMDTFADPQCLEDNPNAVPPAEAFAYICKKFVGSTTGKALIKSREECNG